MDDDNKCLECTKAGHTPSRLTRLPLAEGIAIFILSSRAGVSTEIHYAVAEFLEKIGKELSETLLNEDVAKKALDLMETVH
ncbi:MAG: hypothetical protein ABSG90_11705 [Dehalococcoidia bacterium]|jgi:hypothetical protein